MFRVHLLSVLSKSIVSLKYFRFSENNMLKQKKGAIDLARKGIFLFSFDIYINLNQNFFLEHKKLISL